LIYWILFIRFAHEDIRCYLYFVVWNFY